jgi:hypothetical protein
MYRRVEFSGGLVNYNEEFADPLLQDEADRYQQEQFGTRLFNSGMMVPLGVSFVQETTVFREYGPLSGQHDAALVRNRAEDRQHAVAPDHRHRRALLRANRRNGVFALRAVGFKSFGDSPGYLFFGGNSEMRGYDYRQFVGHKAFYGNAELRYPLINAMATPIGVLGGIRGVFFFNIGGAGLDGQTFKPWESGTKTFPAETTPGGVVVRPAQRIDGFRLIDARASYGIGLETFALGFPAALRLGVSDDVQRGLRAVHPGLRRSGGIPQG